MFWLILFLFACINFSLQAQPDEYKPQNIKSYLVNYWAIKEDFFLTKLAYKRFAFLDEARPKEINLLRRLDKNYLILVYKDFVALHTVHSEFAEMNLYEDAFLHSAEPSCLTIGFEEGKWKFYWMPDRRFSKIQNIAYRLYWSFDSTGSFTPTDTIVKTTELKIALPKSARWVILTTILNDTTEIKYSSPVKLFYQENIPIYVPFELFSASQTSPNTMTQYKLQFKLVSKTYPDSVYLYADFNKNNSFENTEKIVFRSNFDTLSAIDSIMNVEIRAGIEVYLLCFKDGTSYRYPNKGSWTTNINNRIKNETYNFFVMDISHPKWREAYINEVLKAFQQGYNGLFCDDTWYKISNWGVDAFPPINYSDSLWYQSAYEFLSEIKTALGKSPLYFNGLFDPSALKFLEVSDGGMTEGFAHSHWGKFGSEASWLLGCNLGLQCQNKYQKIWLPLGGILDNSPNPRLYVLASFLLSANNKALFANAETYQVFAHFPEFDLPTGKPITSAKDSITELRQFDAYGNAYYKREFENCIVFVNPSSKNTVILPEIHNKPQIYVDTLLTIEGGRLYTIQSDSILSPQTAKIILKSKGEELKLSSPSFRNPKAIASQYNNNQIILRLSIEASDSSSNHFKSNAQLPLYVIADITKLGILEDIVLKGDKSPANEHFSKYEGEIILPAGANIKNIKVPFVIFSPTGLVSVAYSPLITENLDTNNYLPNFSFEYDIDTDGIPDSWRIYVKNFEYDTTGVNAQHLRRSVKVHNKTEQDTGGVYTRIYFYENEPFPIKVAGWSKAENVSGNPDNNYSIYCDFFFTDGTPWYGKTTRFSTGTHDWEYSETIYYPPKPIASANIYCLFRAHSGTVWFDNIYVGKYDSTSSVKVLNNEINVKIPSIWTYTEEPIAQIDVPTPTIAEFSIIDIRGNIIARQEKPISEGTNFINLSQYFQQAPSGVYCFRAQINNKQITNFFLIVK